MKLKTLHKFTIGTILAASASVAYAGQYMPAQAGSKAIKNQYVVVLHENSVQDSENLFSSVAVNSAARRALGIRNLNESLGARYNGYVKRNFKKVLNGGVYEMTERQAKRLAKDPRVKMVEQDFEVKASATQSNATWGLDRIDQASGLNGTYVYNQSANNVNAYIIDTGILTSHSNFGGRAVSGIDTVDNDSNATDCNGHGTHVAGTVGSTTYGVAKAVNLIAVRVLNCQGSGSNSGVIAGMDWVADNAVFPAVANMSLGGGFSTASNAAVQRMVDAGVTVVTASGNDNSDACSFSPGSAPAAFNVGSTTNQDARSSFSNFGSCIDIYAPGSNITSTWSNGGFNTISGTSMAAPHVAGVSALYLSTNPNATPAQVEAAVVGNGTTGALSGLRTGDPNILLYSIFDGGSNPPPPPPPPPPTGDGSLTNGVAETGLSGATGSEQFFTLEVPAGATDLSFAMSGGSGDADLYVRFGANPTTSTYECRPFLNGNNETCDISNVQAGTYHVMIRAYSNFSAVSLTGSFNEAPPPPPPGAGGSATVNDVSASRNNWSRYTLNVPAGMSSLSVVMSGGSGDADLYVRKGARSTTSAYDCRPFRNGNNETCTFNNPGQDTWHIDVRAYRTFSGVTLQVDWE